MIVNELSINCIVKINIYFIKYIDLKTFLYYYFSKNYT